MTYYESAEDIKITKKRAFQELKHHGIEHVDDIDTFLKDLGNKPEYDAQEVLRWLGH